MEMMDIHKLAKESRLSSPEYTASDLQSMIRVYGATLEVAGPRLAGTGSRRRAVVGSLHGRIRFLEGRPRSHLWKGVAEGGRSLRYPMARLTP